MKTLFLNHNEASKAGKEITSSSFPEGWDFKVREISHLNSSKRFLIEFFNQKEQLYSYQNMISIPNNGSKNRFVIHHRDEMMLAYIGVGDTPREAIKNLRKKIKADMEHLKAVLNNISK